MYKITHELTSPLLRQFVNLRSNYTQVHRGAAGGDCIMPLWTSSFSQSAFSGNAALECFPSQQLLESWTHTVHLELI